MAEPSKRGFWRKVRIGFRLCRITVLLAILLALCGLIYLDHVGLPDFMKRSLVEALRQRGVDLQFTRLRLRGYHGIVADNVRFGKSDLPGGPSLSAREVELRLDLHQLLRFHTQVQVVRLHQAAFEYPLVESNAPPRSLKVENIETTLTLLPGDRWSLDDFRARFANAQFNLSAFIANASAVRNWKILQGGQPVTAEESLQRLRHFADTLEKISFPVQPDIRLVVQGDAKDLQTFSAFLTVNAAEVNTAWGSATRLMLATKLMASTTNAPSRAEVRLEALRVHTPWAGGRDVQFLASVAALPDSPPPDASWAWWTNFQPFRLDWKLDVTAPHYEGRLNAERLVVGGRWRAPDLEVTNFYAQWPEGTVLAGAGLNVATRELQFNAISDFNARRIEPLLSEKSQEWLDKFGWAAAPHVNGSGSIRLPAWTNRQPDWRGEVFPTLRLAGEVAGTNISYMNIPGDWAHLHFTYTNRVWHLPDLDVGRPEGQLRLAYTVDTRTKDFYWHVRGAMDPRAIRPVLQTNAQSGLDRFTFTTPPVVDAEIWGRNFAVDRLGGHALVTLSNFTFRGETADYFHSMVLYSNRVLQLVDPQLWRKGQVLTAACVTVDFPAKRIYFTNGFSTAEPAVVARAIGPKTAHALEPYHFTKPPRVHVEGYVSLVNQEDTDLRFDVAGGPFAWWKFHLPYIKADAHWSGSSLALTNVDASFYQGECQGWANFDFEPSEGADFDFTMAVTSADLKSLMTDLTLHTNKLEGWLSGSLVVTSANSDDRHSCQGYGHASLHNGLIWDIPMFGILSPMLNAIVPGVGTTRASEATAKFSITNGVVATDDLEIRAPVLRLQYAGTVSLDGRIDARVNAQPFRDMTLVGRMVGMALTPVSKLMEYRVTGTLAKPKSQPVYIPKFIFMPLHPFRTMEDLFNNNSDSDNNEGSPGIFDDVSPTPTGAPNSGADK